MALTSTRRSVPSGRKDTIDADHCDVGVHESQGAEIPSTSRPSGLSARPLFSPAPAGNDTIVWCSANRVPSKLLYASTRDFDET
jgi:hypothetical protein